MENNNPLLSIVVPISDMAGRLERMKNWIRGIDFNCCEVVLVHDVRDSKTTEELEAFFQEIRNKNLKLISGKWGNPGGPRNNGISVSTGDWIAFWDSDDTPCIENAVNAIKSKSIADVHVGAFETIDSMSGLVTATMYSQTIEDIYINPGIWRFVFKKSILEQLRFPELSMGEDQVFLMRLRLNLREIAFHRTVFYKYVTGNSDQLTSQSRAIKDLSSTILVTANFYQKATLVEKKFVGLMLVKQFGTLLKRESLLEILKTLPMILRSFLNNPVLLTKSVITVIRDIARN
jgi:glycosyltransferase involved in cell wall biosynthesis